MRSKDLFKMQTISQNWTKFLMRNHFHKRRTCWLFSPSFRPFTSIGVFLLSLKSILEAIFGTRGNKASWQVGELITRRCSDTTPSVKPTVKNVQKQTGVKLDSSCTHARHGFLTPALRDRRVVRIALEN